jgi:hypothetical protein
MAVEANQEGAMQSETDRQWVSHVLGEAVIDVWSGLPQDIQQKLFEQAVLAGHAPNEEELRARLARFLHDHHARTAGNHHAAT